MGPGGQERNVQLQSWSSVIGEYAQALTQDPQASCSLFQGTAVFPVPPHTLACSEKKMAVNSIKLDSRGLIFIFNACSVALTLGRIIQEFLKVVAYKEKLLNSKQKGKECAMLELGWLFGFTYTNQTGTIIRISDLTQRQVHRREKSTLNCISVA